MNQTDPILAANRLKAEGRIAEAIASLQAALAAQPAMLEARFNLAILHHQIGDLGAAEQDYRAVLAQHPQFSPALQGLSGVLLAMDRPAEAMAVLQQLRALARAPADAAMAELGLSSALKSQGQLEAGLAHNRRALQLAPDLEGAHAGQGEILEQLGRADAAIALYRDRLVQTPADLDAHSRLNMLLFRLGRDDAFLASFDEAMTRLPRLAALPMAKADFLLLAGRPQEAEENFARALTMAPGNPEALAGLGTALSRRKQFDAAIAAFEQAAKWVPDNADILGRLAATLLQAREPARAGAAAARILALKPHDQQALSLLSLALRAQGNENDESLSGYESFVRIFDLEPPQGFSDMAAFNAELEFYLDKFQRDRRDHLNQTLRGGTRAVLRPFGAGHELAERLKTRIDQALARYIAELKGPDAHPFTGRRRKGFAIAGSWSSRITDNGYHLNHIHSGGWISSAYYVAMPDPSTDDPFGGHLKFGEPPWDIGLKDPVRRLVHPLPGRLVLFPSYLWHGTVPFHGPQSRTTIAFDALPL